MTTPARPASLDDAQMQALADAYFATIEKLRVTNDVQAIVTYVQWMHDIQDAQLSEIARLMDVNEQMRKHIILAGLMELSDPIERKGRNYD